MNKETLWQQTPKKFQPKRKKIIKEMTKEWLVKTINIDLSIPKDEFDKTKNELKKIQKAPYPSVYLD